MTSAYSTTCVSVEIGESCTSFSYAAFKDFANITSVTFGSGVISIDSDAFNGCSKLTNIVIPKNVRYISEAAFMRCSGLTSVIIGSSVTSIGYAAFAGCSKLVNITSLATTAPRIELSTFQNIASNGTLYVPSASSGYDVWMGTGNYYLGYYYCY